MIQFTIKNNNLIGYKLDETEYVSIKTYYNENNLLCNNVWVRELDPNTLSFKGYTLNEWTDTKTNKGFVRDYKKKNIIMMMIIIFLMLNPNLHILHFPLIKKMLN